MPDWVCPITDWLRLLGADPGTRVANLRLRSYAYRLGNLLRYTRNHAVPGLSNNGFGGSADLPYLSTP